MPAITAEVTMGCKHKPFISLSRRRRRAKTLKIKNLIHDRRGTQSGVFYDECDNAIAAASNNWYWSDILFLSRDPASYWNAEILTANLAFTDALEEAAFNEAWAMLSPTEQRQLEYFKAHPNFNTHGKTLSHALISVPQIHYSQFGHLSFNDFINKRVVELSRDNPPDIYCGYHILPNYAAGIGLQMIVEAEVLSQAIIEAAILDFRAKGERNWTANTQAKIHALGASHGQEINIKECGGIKVT